MAKLTLASLSAELASLRAEVVELRQQLADAKLTSSPVDTPDTELTPSPEVDEYAALHCGIGYIKTVRAAPTPVVTYFTDRSGQRWCKTRIGNRASSIRCE